MFRNCSCIGPFSLCSLAYCLSGNTPSRTPCRRRMLLVCRSPVHACVRHAQELCDRVSELKAAHAVSPRPSSCTRPTGGSSIFDVLISDTMALYAGIYLKHGKDNNLHSVGHSCLICSHRQHLWLYGACSQPSRTNLGPRYATRRSPSSC